MKYLFVALSHTKKIGALKFHVTLINIRFKTSTDDHSKNTPENVRMCGMRIRSVDRTFRTFSLLFQHMVHHVDLWEGGGTPNKTFRAYDRRTSGRFIFITMDCQRTTPEDAYDAASHHNPSVVWNTMVKNRRGIRDMCLNKAVLRVVTMDDKDLGALTWRGTAFVEPLVKKIVRTRQTIAPSSNHVTVCRKSFSTRVFS